MYIFILWTFLSCYVSIYVSAAWRPHSHILLWGVRIFCTILKWILNYYWMQEWQISLKLVWHCVSGLCKSRKPILFFLKKSRNFPVVNPKFIVICMFRSVIKKFLQHSHYNTCYNIGYIWIFLLWKIDEAHHCQLD